MAVQTSQTNAGWRAPSFHLPSTEGGRATLESVWGPNGLVVAFLCNHCPYVIAIAPKLGRDAAALAALGVGFVGICSNDANAYPEDSFERMADFRAAHALPFPYVHDETQETARAYDAQCTPEFFGFDADLVLRYHGRLDETTPGRPNPEARSELFAAMRAIASGDEPPGEPRPAIGCSIKWRAA